MGLITEATLSQDAQVAWQATYEPYGTLIDSRSLVPHPHLKAGHKGLFAERLDGGVVTGMLGVDRGRLEPGATLLYHNRNRTFSPTLGRFLQSDPNASGLAVIGSVSSSGMRAAVDVMGADLSAMTGDGVGLYQYLGGNPVRGRDPTGLWVWDAAELAGEAAVIAVRGVRGGLENMLEEYAFNLETAMDWAMDWSQPDNLLTLSNNEWVHNSFAEGSADGFQEAIQDAAEGLIPGHQVFTSNVASRGGPLGAAKRAYEAGSKPLSRELKKALRAEGQRVLKKARNGEPLPADHIVHHRQPLEYAHILKENPNRVGNLAGVSSREHVKINREWSRFRTENKGRTPTAQAVRARAALIDAKFMKAYVLP